MKQTILAAIVAAGLLAGFGCSSGGGAGSASAPLPQGPGKSSAATLTLSIPVPSANGARRPAYVSAGTQSVTFSGSGITTQTISLAPLPSAACPLQSGFYVCTVYFSAPVGDSTLTVKTFASTDGTGTPLSLNTVAISVFRDQNNTIPVTLNGVVSTLVLNVSPASVTSGTSQALTATWGAKDAAGNTIVGPGALVNASNVAVVPGLASSDQTDFAVGSMSGNSWPVAYNGAAVAAPTLTLSASGYANATKNVTVNPAATPTPGGNAITNGDFTTNAFDGSAGWYRCYANRITTAGATPVSPSPAPVNQLTVSAGSTAPPAGAATDVTQQSSVPSNTPPPSGNAHFALVGYAGGATWGVPGTGKPNKGNTGICQDIASIPTAGTLSLNIYEGGDDNWSKSDAEIDLYPAGTFTIAAGAGTAGATATPTRLIAENNCYDSAGFEAIFLPAPWGTGSVAISSTARWSGCPQTPGGPSPGGYTPSSGGGFWYSRSVDLSSYAGQAKTLFIGISRDAGSATPTSSGAQYYNYVFVDHVQLSGTGTSTPPPLSVAPNPFSATHTGAATLTASESGYAGQITVTSDNTAVITASSPATASGGSATISVNVVNAGFANLTIKDASNQTVVVPVTVTLTPVTIQ